MNKLRDTPFIILLITSLSCTTYKPVQELPGSGLEMHLSFLASDELEGRYPGTVGDIMAARYIEKYLDLLGLKTGKQEFSFIKSIKRGPLNSFVVNGRKAGDKDYTPCGFSFDTLIKAPLVFAGYGITVKADSFEWDDYKGLNVKNKWIMVLRGSPAISGAGDYLSLASDDRDKAMLAADNGAAGLILVSGFSFDREDKLIEVDRKMAQVGIPVFHISRSIADSVLKTQNQSVSQIESGILSGKRNNGPVEEVIIEARSDIEDVSGITGNIFGILSGSDPILSQEYIIVGAHYDHLGNGGPGSSSRRQDTSGIHNGADDNASGVSVMLEMAARLKNRQPELKRSFIFVAFGAEEMGLLGSKYFVNHIPVDLSKVAAMINLDMVGRLDTSRGIQVGGAGTSIEADSLIKISNRSDLKLRVSREGSGPSDHSSFYGKNIPVFFITTGAHTDYHTPQDDADRINYEGMTYVSDFTENLAGSIDALAKKPTFSEAGPKETAGPGYRFKVTLGFMPDFSSPDIEGVRVEFVTKGKAAERGGIRNGDVITAIDGLPVKNIYDYMYRLGKLSRNQIISVEVLRNGIKEILLIQL